MSIAWRTTAPLVPLVVMRQAVIWAKLAPFHEAQCLKRDTLEGLWIDLWSDLTLRRFVCVPAIEWGRENKPDAMRAMSVAGGGKR